MKFVVSVAVFAAMLAAEVWLVTVATTALHNYLIPAVPQTGMAGGLALVFSVVLLGVIFGSRKVVDQG